MEVILKHAGYPDVVHALVLSARLRAECRLCRAMPALAHTQSRSHVGPTFERKP